MLARGTLAAPPKDRFPFDKIVEPGLADLFRQNFRGVAIVFERADEGESAGDVVVGHDERQAEFLIHV